MCGIVECDQLDPGHWTLKEIDEQPESALRVMEGRLYPNFVYFKEFEDIVDLLTTDHLILLGCGTSYFAGQYGLFFLKELCDFTTVQLFDGAEFSELDLPKHGKTTLLFLSQSGETKELHRCIEIGRQHHLFLVGMINVEDSRIAREVDAVCYLKAGREAYTSHVICLALLSVWFAQQKDLNLSKRMQYLHDLQQLSQDIRTTLDANVIDVSLFQNKSHCFLLGKGPAESVAKEGALKIKEMSCLHCEGSSLKRGLTLEPFLVILIDSNQNKESQKAETAYEEIKARHAPILWISPKPRPNSLWIADNQTFGPLLSILPLQQLAYHLSRSTDLPRNLAR